MHSGTGIHAHLTTSALPRTFVQLILKGALKPMLIHLRIIRFRQRSRCDTAAMVANPVMNRNADADAVMRSVRMRSDMNNSSARGHPTIPFMRKAHTIAALEILP